MRTSIDFVLPPITAFRAVVDAVSELGVSAGIKLISLDMRLFNIYQTIALLQKSAYKCLYEYNQPF